MQITKLTAQEYITTQWSGGTTTQVAIAPEGAVYADRTFDWRISSAVVALPESDFTALPDYDRIISTLEGGMELAHEDGRRFSLAPFEIYAFDGGRATHSWGSCRDFNLMMRKGKITGSMTPFAALCGDREIPLEAGTETALLYLASGTAKVFADGREETLQASESLMIHGAGGAALRVQTEAPAGLMLIQVRAL